MAYNPFDFFRRNQKSFFAVLTAFVMVMFVLSFGQGDFFSWLPQWLGSKRGQGPVVATLDGRKLYSSDIDTRRSDRILANQFMGLANQAAAQAVAKDLRDSTATAGERTKATLEQLLQTRQLGYIDFQTFMLLQQRQQQLTPELAGLLRDTSIKGLEDRLQAVLSDPTTSKDDQNLAKSAQLLLRLDLAGNSGRNYFSNHPLTERDRELFEFDLWLRKADRLGISITAEDAKRMYLDEFYNRVPRADLIEIEKSLNDRQGYSRDRLFEALAAEFRVRAAQAAVLGPNVGRNGPLQAFVAPFEGYQFYKDQVVAGTYSVMAVPVENYLDKVTAQPTDGELRELFTKYRDKEPNPASETPGFKKPREMKVAWLEVKGDEPFYTKAAAETLSAAEAHAKLAFALVAPVGGPVGLHAATAPLTATLSDPAFQSAYDRYRQEVGFRTDMAWSWSPFQGGQQVVDTSLVRPNTLASAAGAAAGAVATRGSPFTPLLVLSERVKAEDRNDRARAMVTLLAPPTAAGSNVVGGAVAASARLPAPLPLAVVRPELADQVKKRLAQRIATEDVNRFISETARLSVKKDKTEAREAIAKFIAERGLKTGESTAFHDAFSIEKDAGLKPLLDKKERGHLFNENKPLFGRTFFIEPDPNDPQRQREQVAKSMFAPRVYPEQARPFQLFGDESEYLFWRTAEVPAETPKSLEDVRAKVVAAWKEGKARELAKQAAEQLQAQVQEALKKEPGGDQSGVVERVARDVHTKYASSLGTAEKANRAAYFLVQGVAPLPDRPASTGFPGQERLQPWMLRPRPEMQYPALDMHNALLKHKDDPFGTTVVSSDQPKDAYFVAVLQNRADRDSDAYYRSIYSQAGFPSELARAVGDREKDLAARQAREQALALLMAEFKVANVNAERLDKGGDTGE